MITGPDGAEWGTAGEIASRLGVGVTTAMVRWWVRDRGLHAARVGRRTIYYSLTEVSAVERETRVGGRGRRRAA